MLTAHDTAAVITGIGSALPSRVVTNETTVSTAKPISSTRGAPLSRPAR